jgi:hypothetical protein
MRIRLIIFFLLITCYSINAQVTLNLKLFIEGYYTGNGLMDNYGSGGCLFVCGISANPDDADTITVSLLEPQHLSLIETQRGILQTNGLLTVQFFQAVQNNLFFIRIQHRNALETWSANPIVMQSITNYDFTDSVSKAFGNNMINVGTQLQPHWAFYSGDISDGNLLQLGVGYQDGIIEAQDYTDMENALGLTGYQYQDLTGNGIADSADWFIMEANVYAIRGVFVPNSIGIDEVKNSALNSNSTKFISVKGTVFLDKEFLNDRSYNIFNLNGEFIYRTNKEELKNGYTNLQDGIYFLRN